MSRRRARRSATRKKKDRREYVRVFAKRNADGVLEVTKYPREGAGLLSSLTETDGFAELAEDITDDRAGRYGRLFCSYAALTR